MRTTRLLAPSLALALVAAACDPIPSATPPSASGNPEPSALATPVGSPGVSPPPTAAPPSATSLGSPIVGSKRGHLTLSTNLTADAQAVPDAPVTVTTTALTKTYQVLTLKGIVPVPATTGLVGFRFNHEGAGPAPIDMKVYRITYSDGGSTKNRVTNSDFSSGFYSWGIWGSGRTVIQRSDRGGGRMLRLRASADEDIGLNNGFGRVSSGRDFRLTVRAMVPPAGTPTGYAAVFFLWGKNNTEGYRVTVPLVAAPIPAVTLTTDAAGAIALDEELPAGRYTVRISYAGDATHAPAVLEQEVTVR